MEIQCPCGAKYAFEVVSGLLASEFTLVFQTCQVDLSAAVRPLVEREIAALTPFRTAPPTEPQPVNRSPASPPTPPASVAASSRVPTPSADTAPRMRVALSSPGASSPAGETSGGSRAAVEAVPQTPRCHRHRGEEALESCRVCQKAICPQCMVQFGYVCSVFCQTRAENEGIEVPQFHGQYKNTAAREARLFKVALVGIPAVLLLIVGAWAYVQFVVAQPKVVVTSRFDSQAYSVEGRWAGPGSWLVLNEGRLSRWDLRTKSEVWSVSLIDTNTFRDSAKQEALQSRTRAIKWRNE